MVPKQRSFLTRVFPDAGLAEQKDAESLVQIKGRRTPRRGTTFVRHQLRSQSPFRVVAIVDDGKTLS